MPELSVIFTRADMPEELVQAWLQHLRDFDTAHPGCHFQVMADATQGKSMAEMVEMLRLHPELTFTKIFVRRPPDD